MLLALFLWLRPWQPVEMVYQNRGLSEWLDDYHPRKPLPKRREAKAAIQAMGENALPDLVAMMQARDNVLKTFLMKATSKKTFLRMRLDPAWLDHHRAKEGFRVLSHVAEPAIPDLVALLDTEPNCHAAIDALARIGPAALPALTRVVTNRVHASRRVSAVRALGQMGWEAESAIPLLTQGLYDEDANFRSECLQSLAEIGERPDLVVRAMIPLVKDGDPIVRQSAVESIGAFRDEARAALGSLFTALHDPDSYVRFAALTALTKIDPKAASRGTNVIQRTRRRR